MARNLAIVSGAAFLLMLCYALGLQEHLTISALKARRAELQLLFELYPVLFVAGFMSLQTAALALSFPGAVLTFALAGGAIFGPVGGTAIVLLAVTAGDSLGFLLARSVLRDWMHSRFGRHAEAFDAGVAKDGAIYLFALRMMAVIPYFIVNFAMGLTRMPLKVFAPVSFLGLAPAIALYVNAGTQLALINTPADVLSLPLIASFVVLGLLPIVACYAFRLRLGSRQA